MRTEMEVRTAIVTAMQTVTGIGPVYARYRRPAGGTEQSLKELFSDANGKLHFWMVRRIQRQVEATSFGDIVSVTHVYDLFGSLGVNDSDNTEEAFQAEIEAIAAAIGVDVHLGLGNGVTHMGVSVPVNITDELRGDLLVHSAHCRVSVNVAKCG